MRSLADLKDKKEESHMWAHKLLAHPEDEDVSRERELQCKSCQETHQLGLRQVMEAVYSEKMDIALNHIRSFFHPNSTLMRNLDQMKENLSTLVSSSWQNSSIIQSFNQTMYETINNI